MSAAAPIDVATPASANILVGVLNKRQPVDGATAASTAQVADARLYKVLGREAYAATLPAWRRALNVFVAGKIFNTFIFLCVFVNCVLVVFDKGGDPDADQTTTANQVVLILLDVLTWIFLLEAAMLMVAQGVWVRKIGFFSSRTNAANLLLTVVSLYDFLQRRAFPDKGALRVAGVIARVGRLLRMYRTLAEIPAIRQLFDALRKSVSRLVDILVLFIAFSLVAGLVGMQFFQDSLHYRCATPTWVNCTYAVEAPEVPCLPVTLPPAVAARSPAPRLMLQNQYIVFNETNGRRGIAPASSSSTSSTTTLSEAQIASSYFGLAAAAQASLVVNPSAICQPTTTRQQTFDLLQAWAAAMARQLTGALDSNVVSMASFGAARNHSVETFVADSDANLTALVALLLANSTDYQLPLVESNNWNTVLHGVSCAYSDACVPYQNPEHGFISFDTVFPTFISMYFVTFLTGWSKICNYVIEARGSLTLYFFAFLVLFGALFMLNLVLAILVDSFTRSLAAVQQRDAALQEMREQQAAAQQAMLLAKKLKGQLQQQQSANAASGGGGSAPPTPPDANAALSSPAAADGGGGSDDDGDDGSGGGGGGTKQDGDANTALSRKTSAFGSTRRPDPLSSTWGDTVINGGGGGGLGGIDFGADGNAQEMQAAPSAQPQQQDDDDDVRAALLGTTDLRDSIVTATVVKESTRSDRDQTAAAAAAAAATPRTQRTSSSKKRRGDTPSRRRRPASSHDPATVVLGFRRKTPEELAAAAAAAAAASSQSLSPEPDRPATAGVDAATAGLLFPATQQQQPSHGGAAVVLRAPANGDLTKLEELFAGDEEPTDEANVPFVGVVLSRQMAVAGVSVAAQQRVEGVGRCRAWLIHAKYYFRLVRFLVRSNVVTTHWFHVSSAVLTFINVVLLACVWHGMDPAAEQGLFVATTVFALLFAVELVLKLIALPFKRFMRDIMNLVDLLVTILAVVEFSVTRSTAVTALRCTRILRLLAVFDSLRDTVNVLRRGLVSTLPLIVVLAIFIYFYAVVGMALFSGQLCMSDKPNRYSEPIDMFMRVPSVLCASKDPLRPVVPVFNFDNFGSALLSTFVVFVGDSWNGMLALGMERTGIFVSIWYLSCFMIAGFIVINLFIAAMIEACAISREEQNAKHQAQSAALWGNSGGGLFKERKRFFLKEGADKKKKKKDQKKKDDKKTRDGGGGTDDDDDDDDEDGSLLLGFIPRGVRALSMMASSWRGTSSNAASDASPKSAATSKAGDASNNTDPQSNNNFTINSADGDDISPDHMSMRDFALIAQNMQSTVASAGTPSPAAPAPTQPQRRGGNNRRNRANSLAERAKLRAVAIAGAGADDDGFDMILDGDETADFATSFSADMLRGGTGGGSAFNSLLADSNNNLGARRHQSVFMQEMVGILQEAQQAQQEQQQQQQGNDNRKKTNAGNDADRPRTLARTETDYALLLGRTRAASQHDGGRAPTAAAASAAGDDDDDGANAPSQRTLARTVSSLKEVQDDIAAQAAANAEQRKKMTPAQRMQRFARRALFGERAYSASQREMDKFGKIMLNASRVLGKDVTEFSDFDRNLLMPYFAYERNARKYEEGKNAVRRALGYMTRHPLYRALSWLVVAGAVFTYVTLSNSRLAPDSPSYRTLAYTELIYCLWVCMDVACRIASMGLYNRDMGASGGLAHKYKAGYLNSHANKAQFVAALFCVGATISSFVGATITTNGLRVVSRCMPLWILATRNEQTVVILRSVWDAIVSLGNVGLIAVLVWITYGIMGTQLFRGTFYACASSPDSSRWGDQTYLGLRLTTREACLNASMHWVNFRHNFDDIWESMETLFGVATTDDWGTIAFMTASAGESFDEAPVPGRNMAMTLFACSFILISALFLLNVFVAVLVNAYFETQERIERNIRHSMKLDHAGINDGLDPEQRDFYDLYRRALCFVKKPPSVQFARGSLRWWIRRISRAGAFQIAFLALSFTNVIVQFTAFTAAPPPPQDLLIVDMTFNIALFIMLIMKVVGSGIGAVVRESHWSVVELLVVGLTFSCSVAALVFTFAPPAHFSALELQNNIDVLGFLRQGRILLLHRVMSATPGARVLVDTIARAVKQLVSALVLLMLLFLTYAALGLTLFGNVAGRDEHTNFWTIPRAFYTLLAVATFDGWQEVMDTAGARPPNCDPNIGGCGFGFLSPVFFMTFIVLGQWVGISIFVAILVESFSRSERQERLRVQSDDVKRFRRLWKKHCRIALGRSDATSAAAMPFTQLPRFLMELGAPLGPVSAQFAFGDAGSRQATLTEFPDLKFMWSAVAGTAAPSAVNQQQQPHAGDSPAPTPTMTPRGGAPVSAAAATAAAAAEQERLQDERQKSMMFVDVSAFDLPSLPELCAAFAGKVRRICDRARGKTAGVAGATATDPNAEPLVGGTTNKSFTPASVATPEKDKDKEKDSAAADERYATRADVERLLSKLELPTFFSDGQLCVAQYSLFDALIRYYYATVTPLPPQVNMELHALLLGAFGVRKSDAQLQIARPTQLGEAAPVVGLVLRRERGPSGARSIAPASVQSLFRATPSQPSMGRFQPAGATLGDKKRDDDLDGFDDCSTGNKRGRGASNNRAPWQHNPDVQIKIENVSVGALFNIMKIQAYWRGAHLRLKLRRMAEAAAEQLAENKKKALEEKVKKRAEAALAARPPSSVSSGSNAAASVPHNDSIASSGGSGLGSTPVQRQQQQPPGGTDLGSWLSASGAYDMESSGSSDADGDGDGDAAKTKKPDAAPTAAAAAAASSADPPKKKSDGGETDGAPPGTARRRGISIAAIAAAAAAAGASAPGAVLAAGAGFSTALGDNELRAITRLNEILHARRQREAEKKKKAATASAAAGAATVRNDSLGARPAADNAADSAAAASAGRKKRATAAFAAVSKTLVQHQRTLAKRSTLAEEMAKRHQSGTTSPTSSAPAAAAAAAPSAVPMQGPLLPPDPSKDFFL